MKWIGKAHRRTLGALALGPLGALFGVLLGHQFDEDGGAGTASRSPPRSSRRSASASSARPSSVMGYLAKADGRVSELEIAAARAVMAELRLDANQTREAIACFTAGKQPGFDFAGELAALRRACRGRPDLTRIFLEIQVRAALAGNNLDGPVRPMMQQRGRAALASRGSSSRTSRRRCASEAAPSGPTSSAGGTAAARGSAPRGSLRVLESTPGASDEEIAKAYRRQLHRHHPDKLKANGLPDSMIEHAKQRTQQIIEAWELVRERRGI